MDLDLGILKDSSSLQYGAFFDTLAHISGKADRMLVIILPRTHLWTRTFTSNIGSHPHPNSGSPDSGYGLRIRPGASDGWPLAEVSALRVLLLGSSCIVLVCHYRYKYTVLRRPVVTQHSVPKNNACPKI